jgi:hypothetical protein
MSSIQVSTKNGVSHQKQFNNHANTSLQCALHTCVTSPQISFLFPLELVLATNLTDRPTDRQATCNYSVSFISPRCHFFIYCPGSRYHPPVGTK